MEKIDYSIIDNIKIDDCDLIVKDLNKTIYRFCFKNGINTLGDLIRKFDNNELEFRIKKGEAEIKGFIDLIKYRYFNINLSSSNILFDEIDLLDKYDWKQREEVLIKSKEERYPLRRLGFTLNESDMLIIYVNRTKMPTTVIQAILNYLDDSKDYYIHSTKEQFIFLNKLMLIKDYYKKCVANNTLSVCKLVELEERLKRYKELSDKRSQIEAELDKLENDINVINKYVNEEDSIKLVKKYLNRDNV